MFDYVEFVAEYAPVRPVRAREHRPGHRPLRPHDRHDEDRAGAAARTSPIRAIGSGIQNLLFADVRTVADVERVRARRARRDAGAGRPPRRRACGATSASSWKAARPAFVQALDDAVIALMIEKKPGGREPRRDPVGQGHRHGAVRPGRLLDEHRPGRASATTPTVREAEQYVIETALKMGIAPRAEIAHPDEAPLPRHGRQALLHRHGREHPVRLVQARAGKAMREISRGPRTTGRPRDAGDTAYPRPTA